MRAAEALACAGATARPTKVPAAEAYSDALDPHGGASREQGRPAWARLCRTTTAGGLRVGMETESRCILSMWAAQGLSQRRHENAAHPVGHARCM